MTNKLTVEQVDCDAMESILWVQTIIDDRDAIAQAFARHRQQSEARAAGLIAAARALAISAGKLNVALDRLEKFRRHKEALVRDMTIFADALTAYRSASTMRDTK